MRPLCLIFLCLFGVQVLAAPCEFKITDSRPLNFVVTVEKTKKCQNVDEDELLTSVRRRIEKKLDADKIRDEKAFVFLRLEMLPSVVQDLREGLRKGPEWNSKKGEPHRGHHSGIIEGYLLKGVLVQKVAAWGWTLEDVRLEGVKIKKHRNQGQFPESASLSLKIDAFKIPDSTTTTTTLDVSK